MMTWGQPRLMRKVKETVSECMSQMFDLVLEKSEIKGERDRFLTYRELDNAVQGRIKVADRLLKGLIFDSIEPGLFLFGIGQLFDQVLPGDLGPMLFP